MAMGPNPLEIALMILLSGMGVPPAEEDPLSAKIAPRECLVYMAWAGTGTPDAASGNSTEQVLAEPKVREFLDGAGNFFGGIPGLQGAPNQGGPGQQIGQLVALTKGKAGAFYLSDLQLNGNNPPTIVGGGLLRLNEDIAEAKKLLEGFQASAPEGNVTKVMIGNREFYRVVLDEQAPVVTWGVAGKYLLFGFGDGAVEELMQRARGQAPPWLTAAKAKLKVPRRSSIMYMDLKKMIAMGVEASGEPEAQALVSALGVDKINTLVAVNGLDENGCVMRSELTFDGNPTGIFTLLDTPPLTDKDIAQISKNSPAALAFKLDGEKVLDLAIDVATQLGEEEGIEQGLAMMKQQTRIDLRADVLASLGDTWRVHAQPGPGGLMNGWTVSVKVRDRQKLEQVQQTLLAMAQAALQDFGPGGPSVQSIEMGGFTAHSVALGPPGTPSPTWCITDDQLIVAMSPDQLETLLKGAAQGGSIAQNADVKKLFQADSRTLAFAYIDAKQVANTLLPMAKLWLPMMAGQQGMPPMNTENLPPAESIVPHLRPSLFAMQRTADGVEFTSHQTLPGGNVGAAGPVAVALLLPAVQAAREAARRAQGANNLKQIALALHNYHDTYRALPAGYSSDADGNALLSWRVHILPFVEQQALYERFHLDEPWDSEHNKALIPLMPQIYRCPNSTAEPGMSNYVAILGKDSVFVRPRDGDLMGTTFAQILDGTANTIMTAEVPDESAVTWTKPADFVPDAEMPTKGLTGLRPGGFQVGFTDGSVRFIAETIDADVLKALFTKSGGEQVPRF